MKENNDIELMLDVIDYKNPELLKEINDIKNCSYLIKSPYYELGLTKACEDKDVKKLQILKKLFCNNDLIWSRYYEYVIDRFTNISNNKRLERLIELSLNIDLLNSNHFKFAVENACKAKNMLFLNTYILILTNKSLLNSKYYKYLFNRVSHLKNIEISNLVIRILNIIDNNEFSNVNEVFNQIIDILDRNHKLYINYLLSVFIIKLENMILSSNKDKIYVKKNKPSI